MEDEPKEILSEAEVQRHFPGGPLAKNGVLVLIGGRMYKREREGWCLLDNRPLVREKEE